MNYTEPIIKGEKHVNLLPQGTALVLEGGGTRGFYSAGVFEAFMDAGIMFPYVIGVSAGAANAMSYVSGQKMRNRVILEKYVGNKQYVSRRNLLRHGTLFGYDFIFETVPTRHVFFDWENFHNTDIHFLTGAVDCATGQTVWFEKSDICDKVVVTRASCSVPLLAKIVKRHGLDLLDGGISDPIPIEKSVADGNNFHVIVLTRNSGYSKTAFKHGWLLKLFYKEYPKLIETILNRHETYNRQLALCEKLEQEKRALIIRPQKPISVDRTSADIGKLLELYDEGHFEGAEAVRLLTNMSALPLHSPPQGLHGPPGLQAL